MSDWKSFDNDLSVDVTTLRPQDNAQKDLQKSIISKFPDAARRTRLEPFKIVTLKWLIDIGKATPDNGQASLPFGGKWGAYYMMVFSESDKYLPVGDVYIQPKGNTDLNQIPVLLVKNDAHGKPNKIGDYCAIIPKNRIVSDESWSGDHAKCSGGDRTRNFNIKPNGIYESDFQVLGTFIAISGHWRHDWRNYDGYNPVFAAVNKKYLKEIDGTQFNLGDDSGSGCWHDYRQVYSTPFYTFFKQANKAGGGAWKVFDILPRTLIASCCSDTLPGGMSTDICEDYKKNPQFCIQAMKNHYCIGGNLTTQECKTYCKNNDCDTNLQAYCRAGTYEDQKKKYEEQPEVCSCFMDKMFYMKKDDEKYSAMGIAGRQLKELLISANVYDQKPECTDLKCKFGGTTLKNSTFRGAANDCQTIQIQNCINNAAVNNQGNLQGAINASQANNCVQQNRQSSSPPSNNDDTPSGPPSNPSGPPSSSNPSNPSGPPSGPPNNTMLYIIIGGVVLLILIILIAVLLLRK